MKMISTILKTGLILCSILGLIACDVNGTSSKKSIDPADLDNITSQETFDFYWDNMTENQREFEYCYEILDYFYLFAHSDSLKPKGTAWYNQLQPRYRYIGSSSFAFDTKQIQKPAEILDTYFMYIALSDMYTQYIDPAEFSFEDFVEEMEARDNLLDLGVNVHPIVHDGDTSLVVMQVFKESPAEKAKIAEGDTLLTINGLVVKTIADYKLIANGPAGTSTSVVISRNENGETVQKTLDITYVPYLPPTVNYKIIDSIAVIQITEYTETNTTSDQGTYGEFLEALEATKNTKATIIDLRNNPGGDGEQCKAIAAESLNKNDIISIEYSVDTAATGEIVTDTIFATEDGIAKDRYTIFLANENSGSCSEYHMAGVIANKYSPVIGNLTYGKGVGYSILPSYLEGAIIVTTVIVYDLNHKTYHMYGIAPDIELHDDDDILDTALAIAKEGSMQRTATYGTIVQPNFRQNPYSLEKKAADKKIIPSRKDLGMYKIIRRENVLKKFTH